MLKDEKIYASKDSTQQFKLKDIPFNIFTHRLIYTVRLLINNPHLCI